MNVLLVDNRDSFTFNLAEACGRLGASIETVRNHIDPGAAVARAEASDAIIILSPGPGHPAEAGCCMELAALAKGRVPLLGICLGHQVILLEAGGRIERAPSIVHGKSSLMSHDGRGPFAGLPDPLRVGRYHSLGGFQPPPCFEVHAWLGPMAMAVSSRPARQVGLQFHPESILTPLGDEILERSLGWLTLADA